MQPTETLEDSIARDTVEQGKLSGSTSLSRAGSDPRKDKEKRKTLRKNIFSNNSRVRLITSSSEGWDGMMTESSFELRRDEDVLTCEDFMDREHNEKALALIERVNLKLSGLEFDPDASPVSRSILRRNGFSLLIMLQEKSPFVSTLPEADSSAAAVNAMSVEDQVGRIIAEATTPENLCRAYMGWFPFW